MSKMTKTDIVALLRAMRETATDEVALQGMDLYPLFDSIKGTYQKKGTRCRFEVNGEMYLYKLTCEDQTTEGTFIADNYTPVDAPAIWSGIDVTHAGTIEDPIPASAGGMDYIYGKYYMEDGTIYLCTRTGATEGEIISLDHTPSQLVGHYFEIVVV